MRRPCRRGSAQVAPTTAQQTERRTGLRITSEVPMSVASATEAARSRRKSTYRGTTKTKRLSMTNASDHHHHRIDQRPDHLGLELTADVKSSRSATSSAPRHLSARTMLT